MAGQTECCLPPRAEQSRCLQLRQGEWLLEHHLAPVLEPVLAPALVLATEQAAGTAAVAASLLQG